VTGVVGTFDPVTVVDDIIFAGGDTADRLLAKAGILKGNFSFYLGAVAVYVIVGLTAIYTIFLLSLSRIALCVLLALGPLFIMMLFFDSTKRLFEQWIAQMVNYALITILTIMVASLMLHVLSTAADQAVARGAGIKLADAVRVCMAAGLTFLIMRQIMPMAAGLASGVALSSFGAISRGLNWAFGGAAQRISRSGAQFGRGMFMDDDTTRWDSLSRKAGYHTKQGIKRLVQRDNRVKRRGPAALAPPIATGASQ
jgi:type IV secretion system protein VirB6